MLPSVLPLLSGASAYPIVRENKEEDIESDDDDFLLEHLTPTRSDEDFIDDEDEPILVMREHLAPPSPPRRPGEAAVRAAVSRVIDYGRVRMARSTYELTYSGIRSQCRRLGLDQEQYCGADSFMRELLYMLRDKYHVRTETIEIAVGRESNRQDTDIHFHVVLRFGYPFRVTKMDAFDIAGIHCHIKKEGERDVC